MTDLRVRWALALGWPLPRYLFPGLALVVALATAITTRPLLLSVYSTWPDVSAAWHESLIFAAPLAAGAAAAVAAQLFQRESSVTLPVRRRVGLPALVAHLGWLAGWVMLGHVVGMVPATTHAVLTATWGNLRLVDVLVSLAGLGSMVAVAFAVGVLTRSVRVAPLVALAAFVVTQLPNAPLLRPLALLQPVQQWTSTARFVPNNFVVAFSLIAAVTLVAAALTMSHLKLRSSLLRPEGLVWAFAPIVLLVVAFAWRPELYVDGGKPPRACEDTGGTRVCLHQAYAASLDEVVGTVGALQGAGISPLLSSVKDTTLMEGNRPGEGEAIIGLDLRPADERLVTQGIAEQVAEQVTAVLQPRACRLRSHDLTAYELAGLIRGRVLADAGFSELAQRLMPAASDRVRRVAGTVAALSPRQFRRLIAAEADTIAACRLTSKDFTTS